jgi:hypothetical protein
LNSEGLVISACRNQPALSVNFTSMNFQFGGEGRYLTSEVDLSGSVLGIPFFFQTG